MARKSFEEALKDREKAKKSGTYTGAASGNEQTTGRDSVETVLKRRNKAIKNGTYKRSADFPERKETKSRWLYNMPSYTVPKESYQEAKKILESGNVEKTNTDSQQRNPLSTKQLSTMADVTIKINEKERRKAQLDYQFSQKDENGNIIGGLSWEQVQEEKKKYAPDSDEYKYLSNYTGYTNLNDIQKALKEERKPFVYQGTKMSVDELFKNKLVPKLGDTLFQLENTPRNNVGNSIFPNAQVGNIDYSGILNPNNKSVSNNMTLTEALGYDLGNAFDLARKGSTNGSEKTELPYERAELNKSYIEELEKLKTEREKDHLFEYYEHYMDANDFEKNSTYKKEKSKTPKWYDGLDKMEELYECAKLDDADVDRFMFKYYGDDTTGKDVGHFTLVKQMTDDEKNVFYYIYNTKGKEEAKEYFEDLKPNLNRRNSMDVQEQVKKASKEMPGTMSALSIPISIIGGVSGGLDTAYKKATGQEIDYYSPAYSGNLVANTVRQQVGEDIYNSTKDNKYLNILGTNVPSFSYQIGMSMGDTLVGSALFNKGYSVVAGSNAYQTKARELYEAGEDAETIERTALLTGATEVAFEYISLDKFLKETTTVGAKQVLKSAFAQAGVEAQEELCTEIANIWIDNLSRGDSSDFAQMRKELEQQGVSEKEIKKKIAGQVARQLIESTVGGALSGGFMGGGKSFLNNLSYTKTEKQFINDTVQERVETKEKESGKKVTNKERQEIQDKVVKEFNSGEIVIDTGEKDNNGENVENLRTKEETAPVNVKESMAKMNQAQSASELVEILRDVEERGTEKDVQQAQNYYEYQKSKMLATGVSDDTSFQRAEMQLTETEAYNFGRQNQSVSEEQLSYKGKIAYNNGQQEYLLEESRTKTISDKSIVEQAEATDAKGNDIIISKLQSVEGEPEVITNNGTAPLRNVTFSNVAVQILYNNASTKGSTEAANVYLTNYPAGMPVNNYDIVFERMARAGELGVSIEGALKRNSVVYQSIGEKGLREMYDIGKKRRVALAQQNKSVKKKGTGKVVDQRTNKAEEPLMEFYEKIVGKTGLDIVLNDSDMEGINGYFSQAMSEIVLNTEENGYSTVLHELGEFTDLWNTEEMHNFQTAFLEWYFEKHGDKVNDFIDNYQRVYQEQEGNKTFREAADEVMRDGLSGLFGTDEGINDFTNWLTENRTQTETKSIIQTITNFLQKLCEKIKAYIKGHELNTVARQALEMESDRATELRKQFLQVADKAIENYQRAEVVGNVDSQVRLSLMMFEKDNRRYVEIDQEQDKFRGRDISEYPKIAKEIINEKFNGKVIGIDNKMFVNGQGRDEFANPSKHISGDIYEAKMRAAGELDNLLDAGINFRNEADGRDGHIHPDVIGGFDYFDTLFKIGDRYFEAVINIKNIRKGKLFKDVTKIKDVTQDIMSSYGQNPKSQFLRTSSTNSISETGENTTKNVRNSLKIGEIEDQFREEYDAWDKINPTKVFKVAVVSEALRSVGIDDKSIAMDSSKIIKIRSKHEGMTDDVIKKIPTVINDPIMILESKTTPSRIVMLGELVDANGKTVLVVLELNPANRKGIALDEIKVTSAYGKDNLQNFVSTSKVLYVNPDNAKTSSWLTSTGLQLPVESVTTGSVDSIPSTNNVVKNELRYSLTDTSDLDYLWESDSFYDITASSASILEEGAKVLQGKEVDRQLVHKIAWRIKQDYRSKINLETLTDNLVKVFSYMQTQEKANYEDMVRVMSEVAQPVLEESNDYDPAEVQQYQEFKKKLKSTRIKLSDQQKKEVAYYYDSYENFRRKMFGTLTLTEDGEYLDSVWSEIVDYSDGYLEYDANYAEQPIVLINALDMMKPQLRNNFGADNHGVAMDLALQIYEEYFKAQADSKVKMLQRKMVHERAQWHDKVRKEYYQKLAEEKQKMKEKTGTINARVAEVRAALTASELDKKQKQKAAQYRNNIKRTGAQLIKWIESPTDKQHVPEPLKKVTLEFLGAIDFISHRALDSSQNTKRWQEMMLSVETKLSAAMKNEAFDEYGSFIMELDPDFLPTLQEFVNKNDSVEKISLMDYSQLENLNTLINTLKRTIAKANELHANKMYKHVADAAGSTIQDLQQKKDKKPHVKGVEMVDKLLNLDMLDSMSYFSLLGKGGESIYRSIRDGFNTRTWHVLEAQQYLKEVLKDVDPKVLKTWTGNDAIVHEFKVKDGNLKLTTGQIMSLYLLGRRNQAVQHIMQGGIVASEVRKGKKKIVQPKARHVTRSQFKEIVNTLTPEQKKVAEQMQRFLAVNCAEWGNRASMQMYGYKKFQDDRYFPIKSHSGQIATTDKNAASEALLYAIMNQGMTKNIVKGAKNAIMAEDIMDAFVNHVVGMANYDAFAAPLADAMKWFNYKNDGMDGEFYEADTVKEEIARVYSKKANDYFVQLLKDINGETTNSTSTEITDVLVSNYKASAVMANARVIVQQPTAYMRASLVLSPIDMLKGLAHKPNIKKAKANSAIANWKSFGYYETNMGQSMKQIITGQQTLTESVKDKGGLGAQLADEITWGYLWNACESEIKRKNPKLDTNSKEFLQKVTERFDDVIDQTQVVDTILHRTQFMRSKDRVIKMEAAFMSEPHKSYNMLYRAAKQGKKQFGKAVVVYAMTGILTSMAAAVADAWRDDDEDETFGEKYLSAMRANLFDNLNPLGMIPYAKDIISIIQGYDIERMDMSAVSKLIIATQSVLKGNKTTYGVVKAYTRVASMVTGIPAYNLLREAESLIESITGESIDENKAKAGDLYEDLLRYNKEGKTDKYQETYDELLGIGKDDKEIRTGIRTKVNSMFKTGEITEEEAVSILWEWDYEKPREIVEKWKENMNN